jgi:hypothetical protein
MECREDAIGQRSLNGGDGLRREEALAGAEHHLLRLVVERHNLGDWCTRLGDDGRGSLGGLIYEPGELLLRLAEDVLRKMLMISKLCNGY